MKCPHCGQEHPDDFKFCPISGQPLAPQTKVCGNPACKYSNVPIEAKFCPRCRFDFSQESFQEDNENNRNQEDDKSYLIVTVSDNADCTITCLDKDRTEIHLRKGRNIIDIISYPGLRYGWKVSRGWDIQTFDLSHFDSSHITDMSEMFKDCCSLEHINLSKFDTSQVIFMTSMFRGCRELEYLDLGNLNTEKVTSMGFMFSDCEKLKEIDLSNLNTSSLETMAHMFDGCRSLQYLDLSCFDTSQVYNMNFMFRKCSSLKRLYLGHIDTEDIYLNGIFDGCSSLKEVILQDCEEETIYDISKALKKSYINAKIITD